MAIEILGLLVAGAGASYGWWALQRRRELRLGLSELEAAFDSDAAVAFSVASHAVTSRGHTAMWPLHLLYGLLQDETFTAAIERLDGKPDAIETCVLAELDKHAPDDPAGMDQLAHIVNYTYYVAQSHGRKITVCDFWGRIAVLDVAKLVDVDPHALLFLLVHGMPAPPDDLTGRTDVHIILRNDDFTTQEFVTTILRDVFELSEDDAHARMLETHTTGKTIVGRYKAAVARDKLTRVRSRAREQCFPLWVGAEDC